MLRRFPGRTARGWRSRACASSATLTDCATCTGAAPPVAAAFAERGIPVAAVLVDAAAYGDRGDSGDSSGEMVLEALGIPLALLRRGAEVGACLASLSR